MGYDSIMKMPWKDFIDLLKIKSEQEAKKAEMLENQQKSVNKSMNTSSNKETTTPFFRMMNSVKGTS